MYPEIELRTPGEYTLQAKLVSAANCGGDLVATQKILIYDPEIYTNIKPHLGLMSRIWGVVVIRRYRENR